MTKESFPLTQRALTLSDIFQRNFVIQSHSTNYTKSSGKNQPAAKTEFSQFCWLPWSWTNKTESVHAVKKGQRKIDLRESFWHHVVLFHASDLLSHHFGRSKAIKNRVNPKH